MCSCAHVGGIGLGAVGLVLVMLWIEPWVTNSGHLTCGASSLFPTTPAFLHLRKALTITRVALNLLCFDLCLPVGIAHCHYTTPQHSDLNFEVGSCYAYPRQAWHSVSQISLVTVTGVDFYVWLLFPNFLRQKLCIHLIGTFIPLL